MPTSVVVGEIAIGDLFGSWHSVLWIGFGVLVVAQAVLGRTRWSESRPLVLCISLSVVAHSVLIVYAYGTRVGGGVGGRGGIGSGEAVVSLNFLDDADVSDDVPDNLPDEAPEDSSAREALAGDEPTELSESPEAPPEAPEAGVPEPPAVAIAAMAPLVALMNEGPADDDAPPETDLNDAADQLVDSAMEAAPAVVQSADAAREAAAALAAAALASAAADRPEPKRTADQRPVPKVYQNRMSENRAGLLLRFGGSADTEAAVRAAHGWLVANQVPDGRWDADAHGAGREARILGQDRGGAGAKADTGITGLALLALLAAGETHLKGEHREAVQHGLEFLLRSQRTNGDMSGEAEMFARMYCHGIATLALSEAYAITGDKRIQPYVERAIGYTLASQHPTTGGWRYLPGDTGDMSQFGWQLLSLKSAELAGVEIPPLARSGMERFLESVTTGRQRGWASYRPGEQASRTMTAEALVCRYFLRRCTPAQADEAVRFLLEEQPGGGSINFYYWYYATLALHQTQGEAWKQWNERLVTRLLTSQRSNGAQTGSWDPDPIWGNYGGRVFSTALGALCLETYYRYLPIADLAPQTASGEGKGTSAR